MATEQRNMYFSPTQPTKNAWDSTGIPAAPAIMWQIVEHLLAEAPQLAIAGQLLSDGFESGDTSAWSATLP